MAADRHWCDSVKDQTEGQSRCRHQSGTCSLGESVTMYSASAPSSVRCEQCSDRMAFWNYRRGSQSNIGQPGLAAICSDGELWPVRGIISPDDNCQVDHRDRYKARLNSRHKVTPHEQQEIHQFTNLFALPPLTPGRSFWPGFSRIPEERCDRGLLPNRPSGTQIIRLP